MGTFCLKKTGCKESVVIEDGLELNWIQNEIVYSLPRSKAGEIVSKPF